MPTSSKWSLPFRFSNQNFVHISHLRQVHYMPHPSYPLSCCSECGFINFCNFVIFIYNIYFDNMRDQTLQMWFWFVYCKMDSVVRQPLCQTAVLISLQISFPFKISALSTQSLL
jgi:hypothetical protein